MLVVRPVSVVREDNPGRPIPLGGSFSPPVYAAPMATDLGGGLVRGAHRMASIQAYFSFVDVEILPAFGSVIARALIWSPEHREGR